MTVVKWAVGFVITTVLVAGTVARAQSPAAIAAERGTPVVVSVGVSVEATDNRGSSPSGQAVDNIDMLLKPRVDLILPGARGSLELFYAPSLRRRSDPAPWQDDTDFYHQVGLNARHQVTPRLRVRLNNRFDVTEQDMVESRNIMLRSDRNYWSNRTVAGLNYDILQLSNADLAVEYRMRRFDDDATARNHDENELSAALMLRHQMTETLRLMGLGKAVQFTYAKTELERDFSSLLAAVGLEKMLAENLKASILAGWQGRSYEDETQTSDGLPFVQAQLQGVTGPLNLSGTIERGLRGSDVSPFSSQDYLDVIGSVTAALSGKLDLVGKFIYRQSSYDEEQTPSGTVAADFNPGMARSGDRTTLIVEAGLDYRLTEMLGLGFRCRFEDVDSDVDTSFSKNTTRLALTAWF